MRQCHVGQAVVGQKAHGRVVVIIGTAKQSHTCVVRRDEQDRLGKKDLLELKGIQARINSALLNAAYVPPVK